MEISTCTRPLSTWLQSFLPPYLAYGFQNLMVRRFEKPDQPPMTLECYDMASSENAYGVFSFERQDEAVGIGQASDAETLLKATEEKLRR